MDGGLDSVIFHMVDCLGTLCRNFYCQNIQGKNDSRIDYGSIGPSNYFLYFLVFSFWRICIVPGDLGLSWEALSERNLVNIQKVSV